MTIRSGADHADHSCVSKSGDSAMSRAASHADIPRPKRCRAAASSQTQ